MLKKYFLLSFVFSLFLALSVIQAEPDDATTLSTEEEQLIIEDAIANGEIDFAELEDISLENIENNDAANPPSMKTKVKLGLMGAQMLLEEYIKENPKKAAEIAMGTGFASGAASVIALYLLVKYVK